MDRLTVLKALADDSRYAIFCELGRGAGPLSTLELAGRLELHPNTVRLHLERLREAGMVRSATESDGSVGRPQLLWSPAPDAPSLGLEPDGFRVLAHLLADALAASAPRPAALLAVGRRAGEARVGTAGTGRRRRRRRLLNPGGAAGRVTDRSGEPGPAPADPVRAGAASIPPERTGATAAGEAVEVIVAELADLGFDPLVDSDAGPGRAGAAPAGAIADQAGASIAFTSCPFRELATSYPDLVCALHRGVTEGIVGAVVGRHPGMSASVDTFSTLVDPDPCRAEVTVRAGATSGAAGEFARRATGPAAVAGTTERPAGPAPGAG